MPEIAIEMSPSSPVSVGTSISLTVRGSGTDSATGVRWDFGDGTEQDFAGNLSVTKVYDRPGNVTVLAQVRQTDGTLLTAVQPFVVYEGVRGRSVQSSSIWVDEAGRRCWVVNPDSDSVSVLDVEGMVLEREIPVGAHPTSVTVDGMGQVWVSCRDSDELVVLSGSELTERARLALEHGAAPIAVVAAPGGSEVLVVESGKGRLARYAAASRSRGATLQLGPNPRAVAIAADGQRAWVTRFISADAGGELWRIHLGTFQTESVVHLAPDTTTADNSNGARGVMNYLASVAACHGGGEAWVIGKKDNIFAGGFRDGTPLTFETTVRAMLATFDQSSGAEVGRLDFDDSSQPSAIALSPLGNLLFVTLQGNNEMLVLDAHHRGGLARVETGRAPQGVAIDGSSGRVFVQNFMSRSVDVFEGSALLTVGAGALPRVTTVPTVGTEPLAPEVLRGKQLFYDASDLRISKDGYISCAVCHVDGDHDGRVWDFTDRGEGLRNTTSLRGGLGASRGPVHWTGNFDEIQDFEHDIRNAFGGTGLMEEAVFGQGSRNTPLGDAKAGLSADLDALAAYVTSLGDGKRSPHRSATGSMTAEAAEGSRVFASLGCATCHTGPAMSDSATGQRHDVGTIRASSGQRLGGPLDGFDTPTLLDLWGSAPYLHDGSAATLREVLTVRNAGGQHGDVARLNASQLGALEAFLLQLESEGLGGGAETGAGATSGGSTTGGGTGTSGAATGGTGAGVGTAPGLIEGWTVEILKPRGTRRAKLAGGKIVKVKGALQSAAPNLIPFGFTQPDLIQVAAWTSNQTGAIVWQTARAVGKAGRRGKLLFWARDIGAELVPGQPLVIAARASTNFAVATSATTRVDAVGDLVE